jgi:hypothetical protein
MFKDVGKRKVANHEITLHDYITKNSGTGQNNLVCDNNTLWFS